MAFSMNKMHVAALAMFVLTNAGISSAQPRVPQWQTPPALNWKWMNEVTFDYKPRQGGTATEREVAGAIWVKELEAASNPVTGKRDPSFVLIGSAQQNGARFYFTIYDRARYWCEEPPNGSAGIDHMYSRCPLRVTMVRPDGSTSSRDFQGYCALNEEDRDHPRSEYHTELAFDARSSTAYLRVIQHGKVVPECNRSVRIRIDR